jgi:hypothetical protein
MAAVVVTGVSSGIGRACATTLARHGFTVFGSVRRGEDAIPLQQALGERFRALVFDITDERAVHRAADEVRAALDGQRLAGLVNNAGIAVAGPITHLPIAELRTQLEVNLIGPVIAMQAFAPLLGTDPSLHGTPGRIVNVSSVGGRLGAPFLAPYVASKHGIEGLSESARRELRYYGIDVIIVAPGHVATPIWDKAQEVDTAPYEHLGIAPVLRAFRDFFIAEGKLGYPPERVAETVHEALTAARPAVRYAVVKGRLMNWTVPTTLPRRWIDALIAKRLGYPRA